jgi:hypothetical protein
LLASESMVPIEDRQPCPNCGSRDRKIALAVHDESAPRDGVRMKHKRPGVKGYLLQATMDMPGVQRSTGRPNRLTRIFDKNTDSYEELVIDEGTRGVLHQQSHRLSEHMGHGSDRGPRMSPPPQVSAQKATTPKPDPESQP